ncbi:MAG: fumarylacetoacetate hydrolase family protein, partial [Thermoguttaceae bacterium]|nr:fumarylacetoacetate hydrolase family protein [Thermoguttaceae bacterium]
MAVWSEAANGWVALAELLGDESWNFASTKDVLWANAESTFFAEVQKALDEAGADVATLDFANDDYFYLPPVEEPEKILCVGLNYADHVREFGNALPEVPVIFNKAPSALNACDAAIALPKVSNRVDYEGELVVVIGKEGKD